MDGTGRTHSLYRLSEVTDDRATYSAEEMTIRGVDDSVTTRGRLQRGITRAIDQDDPTFEGAGRGGVGTSWFRSNANDSNH